ncbi:hypothetical protein BP6252_11183 [Coleophoma cylindrospora]|uniref:DUF1772-domain-containing protein n=1 Tax=Coleophoma cylindrospora TaxID=1849047 RepID=A0A3D8QPN3_9HELO|nr:hypothetical protein BP6252_11183 [Coleophoma cylindrospora]
MAISQITLLIARAVGIGGAAWLSGNIAALSLISVPALNASHAQDSVSLSTITHAWKHSYEKGKSQNPPVAAVVASSFAYLAWASHRLRAGRSMQLYSVAALLTVGIVPYTLLTMSSTNNKLLAKSKKASSDAEITAAFSPAEDKEASDLLKRWTFLNGIRSTLPMLGAVAAALAGLA